MGLLSRALRSRAATRPPRGAAHLRLLALIVVGSCASRAAAETAFMMQPDVAERLRDDVRERALQAAKRSLDAQGISLLNAREAALAGVTCSDQECIPDALMELHADFGIKLTLLTSPGGDLDVLGSVGAAFHLRELVYMSEPVRVLDRGIERAVDEALRTARARSQRGPGPWLVVDGSPADAELYLDGERFDDGDLPCETKLSPNREHLLRAERTGYTPKEHRLLVGNNLAASYAMRMQLTPLTDARRADVHDRSPRPPGNAKPDGAASEHSYWDRKRSKWNPIIGIPLLVAGVVYTAVGAAQYAKRGECLEEDADACVRRKTIDGATRAALALGVTGVVLGGGAFLIAGVVRERDRTASGALIELGGRF